MSFKLSFRQDDRPIDQETEERYVKKILGNLKFRLGVEIRG
jgi:phenylalanyl-tRNA synthetase beta chain